MRKAYAVFKYLSEENKRHMAEAAAECGFDIDFFDTEAEASGRVSDGEVIYCKDGTLLREMPELKWCHSAYAGVGPFIESGVFGKKTGDPRSDSAAYGHVDGDNKGAASDLSSDDDKDTASGHSSGAILTNSSGSYGLVISEYVIMTAIMLMRRMPEYLKVIERRGWIQSLSVRSIAGSSIAIIGTGDIGRNSAMRFKALGARRVVGFNRSGRKPVGSGSSGHMSAGSGSNSSASGSSGNSLMSSHLEGRFHNCFDEVYRIDQYEEVMSRESFDVLLLCVPGTAESEGLLSCERIALLSDKTFVINVGRGIVIDQDALIDALNEGRIAGAALDVVCPEPLPPDHPLWTAKNCIVTPHISGDMGLQYTVDLTVDIFCDNLRRYARGEEMTHVVEIAKGY